MTDHQPPTVDRGVVVPRGYEALAQGFATTVSDGNTDPAKRRAWVKIEFRGVDACALAGHSMDYLDALVKADIAPAQSPAALDEAVGLLRLALGAYDKRLVECPANSKNSLVRKASAEVCKLCRAGPSESCRRDNPWPVVEAARAFLANLEPSQ